MRADPARPAPSAAPRATPAVVYAVQNPAAIRQYEVSDKIVRGMVNRLVLAVTGETDLGRAWGMLVSPADRVGIKISTAGGALFATHRAVVNAIADGLAAAGVPRDHIIVWDRQLGAIEEAGYRPRAEGYELASIIGGEGYDPKATFTAPVLGKLFWGDLGYVPRWGENPFLSDAQNTSEVSHFAQIVSRRVTKIINVPTMSDSTAAGLAGSLYNVTLPNIDNWRRFTQFGPLGASGLAELYAEPMIRQKVVLHIMDGLVATYAGGPQSHPNYALHHATLFASKDPVALDTVALARLEQWRAERKLPPIGELAAHVEAAGRLGLGQADPRRIEVRNLQP